MALKQGQHSRIVKMARVLDIPVHVTYDREIERYALTPDQIERLMMLAAMADNVFEFTPPVEGDEDSPENHR